MKHTEEEKENRPEQRDGRPQILTKGRGEHMVGNEWERKKLR